VTITTGNYAGRSGTVDSNVYQRTADYSDEFATGYHATGRWGACDSPVRPGGGTGPAINQVKSRAVDSLFWLVYNRRRLFTTVGRDRERTGEFPLRQTGH